MTQRTYSAEELDWLGKHFLTAENVQAFRDAFNRPNATRDNLKHASQYHNVLRNPETMQRRYSDPREELNRDGYVRIIHGNRYIGVKHKLLWQEANGPLPAGMVLSCVDGDKTNCEPSNWELMPDDVFGRFNHLRRSLAARDPELRPTIFAIAKLQSRLASLPDPGAKDRKRR